MSTRCILSALLWLALLCASARQTFAQGGIPLWTNRYNGPGNGSDFASAMAVDSSGNVFVTGYSDGGTNTYYDYGTVKYSSAGVALWTNRYDGPGNKDLYNDDHPYAVAVDSSGNVFVTGESYGSSNTAYDYATIKYSSAGVPLWTNRYNGPGDEVDALYPFDSAYAMAVDSSGNVIVTGPSNGGGTDEYATIKYSSAGVALWTNRYAGVAHAGDTATAMAVDSSGNVFVTGGSWSYNSVADYATIKYSSAGVPLWTNRYDGPGNGSDFAAAMAVDSSGNVVVTGSSYGGTNTYDDYATIKYSSAGVPLWTNRYNGPANTNDHADAVAVDSSGNVFVTGYSTGTNTYDDYATIKYSSAGVPLWTNRYNGPANTNDQAAAVAVDSSGNVFVTGRSYGGTNTDYDYATIAYSSAGVALWTNRYGGSGNAYDFAAAMAADSSGNVFVTGSSGDDYVTIKYSSSLTRPSLTIRRTGSTTVAVSWPASASNFVLQQNTNSLSSINWSNITSGISNDGTTKTLVVNPATGTRFYRLVSP